MFTDNIILDQHKRMATPVSSAREEKDAEATVSPEQMEEVTAATVSQVPKKKRVKRPGGPT